MSNQGVINRNLNKFRKSMRRNKFFLLLLMPIFIYYILFHYIPMVGVIIAFKDFRINLGIFESAWVGFKWFEKFISSIYFGRLLRNTVILSIYSLLIGFPIPIFFALLLNEVRSKLYKRVAQTLSYFPYFISLVIVVGIMWQFLSTDRGMINNIIERLGGSRISFISDPGWFRHLYVFSGVWQGYGYTAIIYLSALSSIDPQLYEASFIDGANRWKQIIYITIPGIKPTIIILLLLSLGGLLSVGFTKIILMYSPATYETADVISTYIYRIGIQETNFSLGAAAGLFNAVINFSLLVGFNYLSKRTVQFSLW